MALPRVVQPEVYIQQRQTEPLLDVETRNIMSKVGGHKRKVPVTFHLPNRGCRETQYDQCRLHVVEKADPGRIPI